MKLQNIRIKNKGETIVEVIVAVVISTMVLTATFLMLNRAISTNTNVKNRVIALNIAREGIEAVRNIRDTNWLKYSGDKKNKWLCKDTIAEPNKCNGGNVELTTGNYTVDYVSNAQRYYLKNASVNTHLDLSTPTDFSEYRLYYDVTTNRYTHTDTTGFGGYITPFYRQIQLVVHDGNDDTLNGCSASPQCQEVKLEIISIVQWKEEGALRTSRLEHHLYNFYERDAY